MSSLLILLIESYFFVLTLWQNKYFCCLDSLSPSIFSLCDFTLDEFLLLHLYPNGCDSLGFFCSFNPSFWKNINLIVCHMSKRQILAVALGRLKKVMLCYGYVTAQSCSLPQPESNWMSSFTPRSRLCETHCRSVQHFHHYFNTYFQKDGQLGVPYSKIGNTVP